MGSGFLQVASTFPCTPVAPSLQHGLADAALADGVSFARFTQMSEYLLVSVPNSAAVPGIVVLLRLEDWVREHLESTLYDAERDAWLRREFRVRVEEFVSQFTILAHMGKPVWLLAFPSNGWIATQHRIGTLCRTYTNLVLARVRDLSQVSVLSCPSAVSAVDSLDHEADRRGQPPFTQAAFDQLGDFLSGQIVLRLSARDAAATSPATAGASELANYLSGLRVQVELVPAGRGEREHVDRILRTAATFTLTGEKPNLSDTEVDALVESGGCMLVNVTDRLSDHGPSGMVAFRCEADALAVHAMALTCPVLGKQVENAVLLALARIAASRQLAKVILDYTPAGRNQATLAFLKSSIDGDSDHRFVLPIEHAETRINDAAVSPGAWSLRVAAP